jgi:integrase
MNKQGYKLLPPSKSSPYYYVRGTEFGIYLKRSTKTSDKREAQGFLKQWREEAKRISVSGPKREALTFAGAAISYMQSGRSKLFLAPLIEHFGDTPLDEIGQREVDAASAVLGGDRQPQTNNRLVYTPTIAILRHAGVRVNLRRPKMLASGRRIEWLTPDAAFSLLKAAEDIDARLGALLCFLLYTGVRLSEALRIEWKDVDLSQSTATIGKTKNGHPIVLFLPGEAVSSLANLGAGGQGRVFRITKCGRLYDLLAESARRASLSLPEGSAFHILRHTHITWRRLYAGQDTAALLEVGLHKSPRMVERYTHLDVTEEARKADLLPTPKRAGKWTERSSDTKPSQLAK